jgi:CRP-like cAMP-binding protein
VRFRLIFSLCVLVAQVALADSYIYKAGNVGYFVMFVSTGEVKVTLTADRSNVDSFGLAALKVLLHKQSVHGQTYLPGDHFGEYCLLSKSGLCPDNALAVTTSEIYTLSKEDLWAVFLYMTYADRRQFLLALMTRVGATTHLEHTLLPEEEIGGGDERIKNLYRTANRLLTEIVDYMDDDPVEDDINRETLQLMHSEAMSQRDLMFLFDDIRTPSGSFTEKSGSGRGSGRVRINRQKSTNVPAGREMGVLAAAQRRSTLSNMPENDEVTGRDENDFSDENSSEAGTSSRRVSASSRAGDDESVFSPAGVGAGAFSRDYVPSPHQSFRKQASMGDRRKALQLLQVSSQGAGINLNDASGLDFAIGGAFPAQRMGSGRQIAQITLSTLAAGADAYEGSEVSSTETNLTSRNSVADGSGRQRRHSFGSVDLTNANRVRPDSTAADDNMVPSGRPRRSEQLNPNEAGAIDFQVFKNAREIEERILGRRPGSVERARKRADSFH